MAFDTTQATAADRVKFYVNGQQITSFATASYPTQNSTWPINSTTPHQISGSTYAAQQYFDGEMAEVNFVDGQALTPTSFGASSIYNQWLPIRYAGTYGTNGFYLPFTNTASTSTLVADSSGNANNWTPNNISLTAGSTYDSLTDVPTLTSTTVANYAVINPLQVATNSTISDGNLKALAVGAGTGITVNANDIQLKNAGSLTNNVLTRWDSSNGQLVDSAVTDNGTTVSISRPVSVTGGIFASGALTGSAVSSSGDITGNTLSSATTIAAGTNITAASGYITAGSPAGAPNTTGAIQGSTGYFTNLTIPGSASISGNVSITGDLSVAGTASFNNTTSLLIADKFVLLASGSTSLTDGGIIVQNAAGGIGTAFFVEASSTGTHGRFAVTGSLFAGASTATADEFMVTVKQASGVPSAAPTFGSTGNGYGNMYIDSGNSDIYIYA